MPAIRSLSVALAFLAATPGVGHAQSLLPPRTIAEVRDSTRARLDLNGMRWVAKGHALGWASANPRLVTAKGDTVPLPSEGELWVVFDRGAHHGVIGAIGGWLVGVGVVLAGCNGSRYCGEQDFRPLLGAVVGYAVGRDIKRDRWVRVR